MASNVSRAALTPTELRALAEEYGIRADASEAWGKTYTERGDVRRASEELAYLAENRAIAAALRLAADVAEGKPMASCWNCKSTSNLVACCHLCATIAKTQDEQLRAIAAGTKAQPPAERSTDHE